MSLNEDQLSWLRYLHTLPPDAKCKCGWYRKGQCPNCDKPLASDHREEKR